MPKWPPPVCTLPPPNEPLVRAGAELRVDVPMREPPKLGADVVLLGREKVVLGREEVVVGREKVGVVERLPPMLPGWKVRRGVLMPEVRLPEPKPVL